MNKDFVPYEEALALNKLKFDKPVLGFRFENNELHLTETECDSIEFSDVTKINGRIAIEAPLYQQAFRWFREKYKWSSYIKSIEYIGHNGVKQVWEVNLKYLPTNSEHKGMVYETYEEAELSCLIKLIEIVKDDG
jgi:hypothetical protein